MSVHYKFKSAREFDTITFDGLHISVDDLKKAISQRNRIGKTADFDLLITNAQTKEGTHPSTCGVVVCMCIACLAHCSDHYDDVMCVVF